MAEPRHQGTMPGKHCGGARNGMPGEGGYDVHLVHDADDTAADEAIVKARELREEAMRRLGVTQEDIDEALAARQPQPRPVSVVDVVDALTGG